MITRILITFIIITRTAISVPRYKISDNFLLRWRRSKQGSIAGKFHKRNSQWDYQGLPFSFYHFFCSTQCRDPPLLPERWALALLLWILKYLICVGGAVDKLVALCFSLKYCWWFHYLWPIFPFSLLSFFVCVDVVICGVLGSPFTWPRTLLGWYKSNNRVSLWVSWIILGKVLTWWTHYYKWSLNMFHFFFAIQILSSFYHAVMMSQKNPYFTHTQGTSMVLRRP